MIGRTPTALERKWLDAIREIGCIVCLNRGIETPAEIHHIEGRTAADAHFRTIPLCAIHHRGGAGAGEQTSRHPYKERFETRFGTEADLRTQVAHMIGWDPLEESND